MAINKSNTPITALTVKQLISGQENADPNSNSKVADCYHIPMYQRNYAWSDGEISQLIQDVIDSKQHCRAGAEKPYYLGTLVVYLSQHQKNESYETIDGQQRLTTLSLLASYLKNFSAEEDRLDQEKVDMQWYGMPNIHFEHRPKSTATFHAITQKRFSGSPKTILKENEHNPGLTHGYDQIAKLLPQKLKEHGLSLEEFSNYLFNHVQVMRVEVPEDTDLNHYFEIMNNRGEQLEKHEILKAKLLEPLRLDKAATKAFNTIWEACSNMEKYVQSGFSPSTRTSLFGEKSWDTLQVTAFEDVKALFKDENISQTKSISLSQLLESRKSGKKPSDTIKDDRPDRFHPVINFPNFLLHVLRVHLSKNLKSGKISNDLVPLDDKRLISAFESGLLRDEQNRPLTNDEGALRVKEFGFSLLRAKFLFDNYIIKREYLKAEDEWTLKRYYWTKGDTGNYKNRFENEGSIEAEAFNKQALTLLSAFHVSTPTMVYKHWLNAAMLYLFEQKEPIKAEAYIKYLEGIAKAFVFDRFLAEDSTTLDYFTMIYKNGGHASPEIHPSSLEANNETLLNKTSYGNITNNLVFNYLDYLLWKKHQSGGKDDPIKKYTFTFRSSVEHYYPQTPMGETPKIVATKLNCFGNLCLISHSKNSKLSNLPPEGKKSHYKHNAIDSPKQHLMMAHEGDWNEEAIEKHQNEMLKILLQTANQV